MRRALAGLVLAIPVAGWCQAPVISGLENAASYQPTLTYTGAIATIFGTNLANATASAKVVPLPLELGGTAVMVGGVAAPLFYVSPTQINFQVPANGSVVVSTAAGNSAPYDPTMATPNAWRARVASSPRTEAGVARERCSTWQPTAASRRIPPVTAPRRATGCRFTERASRM